MPFCRQDSWSGAGRWGQMAYGSFFLSGKTSKRRGGHVKCENRVTSGAYGVRSREAVCSMLWLVCPMLLLSTCIHIECAPQRIPS